MREMNTGMRMDPRKPLLANFVMNEGDQAKLRRFIFLICPEGIFVEGVDILIVETDSRARDTDLAVHDWTDTVVVVTRHFYVYTFCCSRCVCRQGLARS